MSESKLKSEVTKFKIKKFRFKILIKKILLISIKKSRLLLEKKWQIFFILKDIVRDKKKNLLLKH